MLLDAQIWSVPVPVIIYSEASSTLDEKRYTGTEMFFLAGSGQTLLKSGFLKLCLFLSEIPS